VIAFLASGSAVGCGDSSPSGVDQDGGVGDGSGIAADVDPLGDGGVNLDIGGDDTSDVRLSDGDSGGDPSDAVDAADSDAADRDAADSDADAAACDLLPCATDRPCEEAFCDGAVCSVRAVAAGTLCEGERVCDGTGSCIGCSSDAECDDGFSCTVEVCDVTAGTCSREAQDAPCDDGLFCNGVEVCDPTAPRASSAGCSPGARPDLRDEFSCTDDVCDEDTDTISNVPDDTLCDDGNECTVGTCSAVAGCEFTPVADASLCDAGSGRCSAGDCVDCIDSGDGVDAGCGGARPFCVSDVCVACAINDECPGTLECVAGACTGCSINDECDDGLACTVDVCVPATGVCENVASNAVCNDGLFCTGVEECRPDSSLAGLDGCAVISTPVIDDGVDCTSDRCDEATGRVVNEPLNDRCDDSNVCTDDICVAGEGCSVDVRFGDRGCGGDDAGVCGVGGVCGECADTSDGLIDEGCTDAVPDCIDAVCSVCETESEACPLDCAGVPGGGATLDRCGTCDNDLANDCLGLCDGEPCGPSCDGSVDGECADGNPCTADACVEGRCAWEAESLDGIECADGSVCTFDSMCSAGECVAGEVLACDGFCDTGVCDPVAGCVRAAVGTTCDDGSAFTQRDVCRADGACVGVCDDDNPCTIDIPRFVNTVQECEDPQPWAEGTVVERLSACESLTCNSSGEAVLTINPGCASCAPGACDGQCYTGACSSADGCVASTAGTSCNDGDARTSGDVCDGRGGCAGRCPDTECGSWFGLNGTCDYVVELTIGGASVCEDDGNPCTTEYCDRDGNCARTDTAAGVACGHGCGPAACDGAGSCELRQDECEAQLGACWEGGTCDLETETCEGTPRDPYCLEPGAVCDPVWGFCRGATQTCGDGVCQGSESNNFCGNCAADCSGFDLFGCSSSVNSLRFSAAHQAFSSQAYGVVPAYQNATVTRMLQDGLRWFHQSVNYCEPGATSGALCVCDLNGLCPPTPVRLREPLSELVEFMRANPLAVVIVQLQTRDVRGADVRAEFEAAGAMDLLYQRLFRPAGLEPWNLGFATMARKNKRLVVFGPGFIPSENLFYATLLRNLAGDSVTTEEGGSGLFDVDGAFSNTSSTYECADAFDDLPDGKNEHRPVVLRHSTRVPTASWQLAACYNRQRTDHNLFCAEVHGHPNYLITNAMPMDFYNSSANGTTYHDNENSIYTDRCNSSVEGCFVDDDCSVGICGGLFICINCATADDCEGDEWCDTYIGACSPPQTDGAVCINNRQCASGRCEFFLCQSCSSDSDCGSDEFCDAFGGCQPKNFNGVGCITRRECQSDICRAGFCVECNDEADCEPTDYCDRNVLPGESMCVPRLEIGAACSTNFVCNSGNCHALTCSECDEQSDCASDEFCTLDLIPPIESVCELRAEEGESCASNQECVSDSCFGFVCVDTCSNNDECGDGRWCDGVGVCQDEVPNGSVCLTNIECESSNCFLGFCVQCDEQGDCPDTEFCSLDPVPGLSACIAPKDNGAVCVENFECASDSCFLGFCVACNEQSDCTDGTFCSLDPLPGQSSCIAPKAIGAVCAQNFECVTGNCFSGFCVACNDQTDCPVANEYCDLSVLPGQSACVPTKPNGSFCITSVECTSSQCTLGQCGECVDDGQCSANEHCDLSNNCAADVGNNAPCLKNSACTTGLCQDGFCAECNADTGTFGCPSSQHCNAVNDCANDVGNNAVCLRNSFCTTGICSAGFCAECLSDSNCPLSEHCGPGGDCLADVGNNAPCVRDGVCSTGLCLEGFCAECDGDTGADGCPSNQHCNTVNDCANDVGNNSPCLRNSFCTTGICSAGFCAECLSDSNCPSSENCNAGGDCAPDVGNNAPCLRNAQCSTGICSVGFCAECLSDANCPSSENCNAGGDCAADVGNNAPCLRNAQCSTGICSAGFCAECVNQAGCSSSEFCSVGGDCLNKRSDGSICGNGYECQAGCCNFTFVCNGLGC
jgi:hypothetical protein